MHQFNYDCLPGRLCRINCALKSIGVTIVLIIVAQVPAFAQTSAGSVTSVVGSANLQRAGATMTVTVGMAVQTGDQLVVDDSGRVTITLIDGSILEAGSSSTMVIDQMLLDSNGARSSTRIKLLTGILRSVVKHSSHGNPPNFEVHTPNATLAARSTMFDTAYSQGSRPFAFGDCHQFTDEQTYKGTVGAKNAATPDADEVSVEAGYETTIACNSAPTEPGPLGMTGIPGNGTGAFTASEPASGTGGPPPPPAAAPPVFIPPKG